MSRDLPAITRHVAEALVRHLVLPGGVTGLAEVMAFLAGDMRERLLLRRCSLGWTDIAVDMEKEWD
ncbi:MAG: hypothetical protein GXX83_09530 [Gaiellales bacterium]|nr:hypothetical protein [Gaiellales bacterium]